MGKKNVNRNDRQIWRCKKCGHTFSGCSKKPKGCDKCGNTRKLKIVHLKDPTF